MAINAYTGLMGSGKSYEVVENVILPGLLAGRRVVTNVANLQQEEIRAYLVDKFNADPAKIGEIVQVVNDDIERKDFFPVEVQPGEEVPSSVVMPGDLVVVDECWRWWATGAKIPAFHMTFFRMHRHFVHSETKVSCDLVLVVQDISDLDRKLKVVVENTYRMSKHKSLGMTKRYRVDIYPSYRTRGAPIRSLQRKYNKEIFKLYQSYSQGGDGGTGGGNEVAIDDRSNIFKGALFRIVLPALLVVFILCFWWLWKFFHPDAKETKPGQKPPVSQSQTTDKTAKPSVPSQSDSEWRVIGHYQFDGQHYVIISLNGKSRTLINPRQFYFDPLRAYGSLDGLILANYTGLDSGGGLLEGNKK